MGVDRSQRDALIELLAGFLRGEVTKDQLLDGGHALLKSYDPSGPSPENEITVTEIVKSIDFNFDVYLYGDQFEEDQWNTFRRYLAFLATDLEIAPAPPFPQKKEDLRGVAFICRLSVVFMAIGFSLGWWYYGVACVFTYLWFQWGAFRSSSEEESDEEYAAQEKRCREWHDVYPFGSNEQWLLHEPRLIALHLPPFETSKFNPDTPSGLRYRLERKAWHFLCMAFVVGLIAMLHLFGLIFWPIGACIGSFMGVESLEVVSENQDA